MKLKDLQNLKKAKFLRINKNGKNLKEFEIFENLEDFKKRVLKNPPKEEIVEFFENEDEFGFKFKNIGRCYTGVEGVYVDKEYIDSWTLRKKSMSERLWYSLEEIVEVEFESNKFVYRFDKNKSEKIVGCKLTKENLTENGFKVVVNGTEIFFNLI